MNLQQILKKIKKLNHSTSPECERAGIKPKDPEIEKNSEIVKETINFMEIS